jgi:hypothetical protein
LYILYSPLEVGERDRKSTLGIKRYFFCSSFSRCCDNCCPNQQLAAFVVYHNMEPEASSDAAVGILSLAALSLEEWRERTADRADRADNSTCADRDDSGT